MTCIAGLRTGSPRSEAPPIRPSRNSSKALPSLLSFGGRQRFDQADEIDAADDADQRAFVQSPAIA